MKKTLCLIALVCGLAFGTAAQVPVSLAPVARLQFFSQSGNPLAGGFLYTTISGTSTPLATYVDSSGTIQASNPIQLDASGSASIWLQSSGTYRLQLTDANNVQQWVVDGVTGPPNLLAPGPIGTSVPNIVEATHFLSATPIPALSGIVELASGDGICWRNNANSADLCLTKNASDALLFNGGGIPFSTTPNEWTMQQTFDVTAVFNQTTGAPPFTVASTTNVPNLNASTLLGLNWATPGTIGSLTPNTGAFTTLNVGTSIVVNGSPALTGVSGNTGTLASAASDLKTDAIGIPLCPDGSGNVTGSNCNYSGKVTTKLLGADVPLSGLTTVDSQAVTMPSSGCPCRVAIQYAYGWASTTAATSNTVVAYVADSGSGVSTKNYAWSAADTVANNARGALNAGQTSQTYANSTVVTFTVNAQTNASSVAIKEFDAVIGSLQSYLELKVETNQQ